MKRREDEKMFTIIFFLDRKARGFAYIYIYLRSSLRSILLCSTSTMPRTEKQEKSNRSVVSERFCLEYFKKSLII
jgi:hypothetical protein